MKILIAHDGSESADAAVDSLTSAGLPANAEALILSVAEVWLPPPPPSAFEIVEEARQAHDAADLERLYLEPSKPVTVSRAIATRVQQHLAVLFPQWSISVEANYGSVASEIIRQADEWKPDLIVVGSHGRSAWGRFVLGSVSQKVVTESARSVRIGRARSGAAGPLRLLIGIDGSPASDLALKTVGARNWPAGTKARVVIVDEPLAPTFVGSFIPQVQRWVAEANQDERGWAKKLVETAAGELCLNGLIAGAVVREGDPKRVLVEEAEQWEADAIFLGSTGAGSRVGRFVLGSVSNAVAARAHCSVEIVRAPVSAR